MFIVTIDSGTTNTRVRVWQDDAVISEASESVGIRDTAITGSTKALINGIKQAFTQALSGITINNPNDIIVIASGMITSNMGLCEIPHLSTPVDITGLANAMVKKIVPEITPYPIWFITGVKNNIAHINLDNCEAMDIMRGEETESIGAISQFALKDATLLILPGSHSKFIKINQHQQIESCATTMAGEMLDVLTQQTLLSSSLQHQFASTIDEQYLLKGAQSCANVGLVRTAFTCRILDLFSQASPNQQANYLLGAVLYSDLLTIKNSRALNISSDIDIVICGKKILTEALAILLRHDAFFCGNIIAEHENKLRPLSGLGAIAIAKKQLAVAQR